MSQKFLFVYRKRLPKDRQTNLTLLILIIDDVCPKQIIFIQIFSVTDGISKCLLVDVWKSCVTDGKSV